MPSDPHRREIPPADRAVQAFKAWACAAASARETKAKESYWPRLVGIEAAFSELRGQAREDLIDE